MSPADTAKSDRAAFSVHPRAITALGADLITNDLVAVIELVKNSYDALATRVDVVFGEDQMEGRYLEVVDDGVGMLRTTVEDVWCVVATPFKRNNPVVTEGSRKRFVTGDKGLGRLSAARLGDRLQMTTKHADGPCLRVSVDWTELALSEDLATGQVEIAEIEDDPQINERGTRVRIYRLRSGWNYDQIHDLVENLGRLISPFDEADDFKIYLARSDEGGPPMPVEIESPQFLSKPKYAIRGHVDASGRIKAKYEFRPIAGGRARSASLEHAWDQVLRDAERRDLRYPDQTPSCGPFDFEIRAWDIAGEDTLEISNRFSTPKSHIRKAIAAHKGISVYRDQVLVLPKSDKARDWLGLDLRRVSKTGLRLSTSQVVGYVGLSKEANPSIVDTSDREKLVENAEVRAFQVLLSSVIKLLETERQMDRREDSEEPPLEGLFEEISADELLAEMLELVESDADLKDALPILRAFDAELDRVRARIQKRFVFYSRARDYWDNRPDDHP